MSDPIVTAIHRDWGGFRNYWEDAVASSPLNEFVDPPLAPSKPLTYTFTPPPQDAVIACPPRHLLDESEIVEFERVDVSWMFGE